MDRETKIFTAIAVVLLIAFAILLALMLANESAENKEEQIQRTQTTLKLKENTFNVVDDNTVIIQVDGKAITINIDDIKEDK